MRIPRLLQWPERTSQQQVFGSLIWLVGGVGVSILGIWYPMWVDSHFGPDVDSRMGFLYLYSLQFVLGATIAAGFALLRLYHGIYHMSAATKASLMSLGIVLAMGTSSPLLFMGYRVVASLAYGIQHPDA
ncbi:MAG TPA: hypothetical protein VMF06_07310 [Candidatus Limnocylindria bacterium]|jgi:hypothetical protein|nr:hypothetical protein [Candidatus Limnocylindria bacterium]